MDRSEHNSRCIAQVLKQTNKLMYVLTIVGFLTCPCLTKNGPAKSMPTVLNGKAEEVSARSLGSCPISWEAVLW